MKRRSDNAKVDFTQDCIVHNRFSASASYHIQKSKKFKLSVIEKLKRIGSFFQRRQYIFVNDVMTVTLFWSTTSHIRQMCLSKEYKNRPRESISSVESTPQNSSQVRLLSQDPLNINFSSTNIGPSNRFYNN